MGKIMKKYAVYTACIGKYDDICQPEVVDSRFDYILFTDDTCEAPLGVWQVRHVDYCNLDKTRIARYVKTHPHELLPDYEATLWMDSSIQIISSSIYERVIALAKSPVDLSAIKHPKRDCIYDEAFEVASRKSPGALEYEDVAMSWCHRLWGKHYPMHNGLYETGILYRRNDAVMEQFDNLWWTCIDNYSKRDQLSFNYVVWNCKPTYEHIFPVGEHAFNSPQVRFVGHANASARKALHLNFSQRIRYRYRVLYRERAFKQWCWTMKQRKPNMWLHTCGTITAICYVSVYKLKKLISK